MRLNNSINEYGLVAKLFHWLTFIILLVCLLNPQIDKTTKKIHKDIVLVITDMTQSILVTKKDITF